MCKVKNLETIIDVDWAPEVSKDNQTIITLLLWLFFSCICWNFLKGDG